MSYLEVYSVERRIRAFDSEHEQALRGIWFLSDVHGGFDHIEPALSAAPSKPKTSNAIRKRVNKAISQFHEHGDTLARSSAPPLPPNHRRVGRLTPNAQQPRIDNAAWTQGDKPHHAATTALEVFVQSEFCAATPKRCALSSLSGTPSMLCVHG